MIIIIIIKIIIIIIRGERRKQFPPLPPPSFLFFAFFPAFSMNSRGNACYEGEGLAQRKHNLSDEQAEPDVRQPHFL